MADRQANVQDMLDDAARAFANASGSSERVEVLRDLLADWYAAWPKTAVTDPHEPIAWQLASLISAAEARSSGGDVALLVEQRDQLVALVGEILREFTQRGHPGRSALRTGWVWEETANGWRERLAALTRPPDPAAG